MESAWGDIQDLGDRYLGDLLAQQHLDLAFSPVELRGAEGAFQGTAQIAAKICSKDAGQRTWARSSTYCPYRITLSHSIGLTCSSRAQTQHRHWWRIRPACLRRRI